MKKRFSMKEVLKSNPYAVRISAKDVKQIRFGEIVRLKGEEDQYAVCTWTVKPDDPGFMRGILLVHKETIAPYRHMAGNFIDVVVDGHSYAIFGWLDAPLNVARVDKVVTKLTKEEADEVYEATDWSKDEGYGNLSERFRNALVGWMNEILMGDLFSHLDDIESR